MSNAEFVDELMTHAKGLGLREMYGILADYRDLAEHCGLNDAEQHEGIVRWKRRIRRCIKSNTEEHERVRVVRDGLGSGSEVLLVRLGEFDSLADAKAYFLATEYIECGEGYGCTGQIYTSWYYVFERHGICYAYHSISIDN